jgi:aspartyl-tRNA(Asn)/glutamyl-tRNA(Gln) amidotransferase subunit A
MTPASDPALLPASELLRQFRRKALSPVEVAQACLARIERLDPGYGGFCLVDAEGALAAARRSEARWARAEPAGVLDGVPTTVKDILLWRGRPTRRGSRTTAGAAADEADAPAVARLAEAGAVLLGKTTTPEFGWKAVTDNPLGHIARNPWNPERTAGGSSGGAAVAAALGMGALHIGTDGGGSIRIPAAFSGIVGLKPTFGRVPAWPLSPFGTVAHLGPMTRTVADAALMLTVMARPDARDWHALPADGRDYRVGLEDGVAGLRIAASADLGFVAVEPAARQAFEAALAALAELGAVVEEVLGLMASPREIFARTWFPAAAHLLGTLPDEQRRMLDPGLQEVVEAGSRVTKAELLDAQAARGALGTAMQLLFDRFDLMVTPATALAAFAAGIEVPDRARYPRWIDWAGLSYPFNLTQQPAASVPCGFAPDGLPLGLQIIGPKYADALVLRAARAFESARPQPMALAKVG